MARGTAQTQGDWPAMTPSEQQRRFGYVVPDCHLAQKARKDAKRQAWRTAINFIHGLGMGALVIGATCAGVYLGG